MSSSDGPCPSGSSEERRDAASRLEVPDNRKSEPLRTCVKEALENYFLHLDGHEASELFDLVMSEVESPLLETVLAQANGNQSQAAAMLGINRATLRKKLKRYHLI